MTNFFSDYLNAITNSFITFDFFRFFLLLFLSLSVFGFIILLFRRR